MQKLYPIGCKYNESFSIYTLSGINLLQWCVFYTLSGVICGGVGMKKKAAWNDAACEGAVNGARTRDPQLGKLMLYQLSYYRDWRMQS